jgi:hypothetical protein
MLWAMMRDGPVHWPFKAVCVLGRRMIQRIRLDNRRPSSCRRGRG